MWAGFLAIAGKELLHFRRRKIVLLFFLGSQAIFFVTLGFIDLSLREVPTVIVDEDHTVQSRDLERRIGATKAFRIKYQTSSVDQARAHIIAGRAQVAVVIPADYARLRAGGSPTTVLTIVDGSDATTSTQAVAAVEGVVARLNEERFDDASAGRIAVAAHAIQMFNPQGSTLNFMLPALLAILLMNFLEFAMQSLTGERDDGNLERLVMTPINYTALMLGKLVPYVIFGFVDGLAYLLVMRFVFGVPILGDLVVIIVAIFLYVVTLLSIGLLAAAAAPNSATARYWIGFYTFPAYAMSGYFFPLSALPNWLRPFANVLPVMHMVEIMRGTCLRATTFGDLYPHFAYFVITPTICLYVASKRFAASIIT